MQDILLWSLTSESVTEGHPDKVCDRIADYILDAYLEADAAVAERPDHRPSRVACEVLCKGTDVIVAGEITPSPALEEQPADHAGSVRAEASVDHAAIVRRVVQEVRYVDPAERFHPEGLEIQEFVTRQTGTRRCGVSVAYAIGVARPVAVDVETFGTGDPHAARAFIEESGFDFRPAKMIEALDLLRPIYRRTTNYGHFRPPGPAVGGARDMFQACTSQLGDARAPAKTLKASLS